MRTCKTKDLTHGCRVAFEGAPGILIKAQYQNSGERWFFLSNDNTCDGATPDEWARNPLRHTYKYSWNLGHVISENLSGYVTLMDTPKYDPKTFMPIISDTDDDKPLFKRVLMTPNKIKDEN